VEKEIFLIPVRPSEEYAVDLVPRRVLGRTPADPLRKRITMARPLLVPLKKPGADAERPAIREHLTREAKSHDFFELHLVLTLYPDQEEPFQTVAVNVALTADDPADDPIAWSLFPLRSATPIKVTTDVGLNAKLGFIQPTVDRKVETPIEKNFVLGLGEGESDFEWRFTETRAATLVGIQRMFAVVKVRRGGSFGAAVAVAATVRRQRLGLLHYNAELPSFVKRVVVPPSGQS